ncbi:MAG: L,D-transpeptidase [Candidatus Saccharimonadales bacterium]
MVFKLIKLVVIGCLVIGLAVFARAEVMRYWNNKLSKEALDFKVPASILDPARSSSSSSTTANGPCSGNDLNQLILVSISQRHLWACEYTTVAYSSPVVTGMSFLAADLTPTGTYHIDSKQTNIHLIGHDSTGSWNDFVYYWMQFLVNQYGAYGFHDATWRPANAFGNISPDSTNASHGCVELPLATAQWLYNWSQIGTTVTIES